MKVRKLIRLLSQDGWYLVATKGSHYQFKHSTKPGKVTVPVHESKDVPTGTVGKICKDARICANVRSPIKRF
ncbi:type II toxin-antitoxin system HicA family toxin [Chroococcidiopsis sp. SAG 2025]|uniref:type II toxin-antitoxin system HicA family toxin n=1 Tax=Chroococcidiopsis sp. SAG 2025 TaxID=171389 RepID=UPI002937441C|nr:type II toxin-antitoxin system HicA family toxin [Chroococcidiopsis sp. SAG 2025]